MTDATGARGQARSPERTRAKVCGITRETDIRTAVEAGADAVGVVADVAVDTPRGVSVERAADLLAAVPPFVTGTLVTMPDDAAAGADLVARVAPDAVQVHGFDPAESAALRERVAVPVLAAVDADGAEAYADGRTPTDGGAGDGDRSGGPAADALVVDSLDEADGGGTGETHDWERTRELAASLDVPVVLAGGLTPDNVAEAVRTVRPFAVDVASGVEREGGIKDGDAVRSFVRRAARALDDTAVEEVDA